MTPPDALNAFVSRFTIDGAQHGPLAGVRFAAKDLFDVAGMRTGAGNPDWALAQQPAREHAPIVAALLAAGARLVGKTHTDELSRGIFGENAHYGTPLNPAAPGRVPGGSVQRTSAAMTASAAACPKPMPSQPARAAKSWPSAKPSGAKAENVASASA